MTAESSSITDWLNGLRAGEADCARRLHQAVYDRLLSQAKKRLGARKPRWIDEDDVALSAFQAFCRRAGAGEFPELRSRDELWRLLVRIVTCKARDYLRKDLAQKRGGGRVRGESAFLVQGSNSLFGSIDVAPGSVAPPDIALIVVEECQELLDLLGDENLAQIAVWKMEGYTDAEIAVRLNCVTRTVERKLERIRAKWRKRLPPQAQSDNPPD